MFNARNGGPLFLAGVEVSATAVPEMSQEAHRQQGKSLASRG
jgi:hypothetical protein